MSRIGWYVRVRLRRTIITKDFVLLRMPTNQLATKLSFGQPFLVLKLNMDGKRGSESIEGG